MRVVSASVPEAAAEPSVVEEIETLANGGEILLPELGENVVDLVVDRGLVVDSGQGFFIGVWDSG